MANVLVDNKDLEKIQNSKSISSGEEGCCYLYNSEIVKLYHRINPNRKIYFEGEKSKQIAFPKDILISEKSYQILGYTMNFLQGINIKNGFAEDLLLRNLKSAYMKLKEEIEKFSYVNMENISLTNILFDYKENHLNLLDTSMWTFGIETNFWNLEKLNYMLMRALSITLDWNRYPLNSQKKIFDLYGMHLNQMSYFIEFLTEIEKLVSERKQEEIKTIGQLILNRG